MGFSVLAVGWTSTFCKAQPGTQYCDMIYAVHQPDFLPWFGFFNKISQSTVFVVLDDVQYSKESYMNRVKLLMGGEPRYFTAPVVKQRGGESYRLKLVHESIFAEEMWKEKLLKTFQTHYARCDHFTEAMDLVKQICAIPGDNLCAFNMAAVKLICSALRLRTDHFVFSSSLGVSSARAQRIVDIGLAVGCDTYLSGTGAKAYNDATLFDAAGIRLTYQQVNHPQYRQPGTSNFHPGLSMLDIIANCGFLGAQRLLAQAAAAH